jgi:hypothetical protein
VFELRPRPVVHVAVHVDVQVKVVPLPLGLRCFPLSDAEPALPVWAHGAVESRLG